MSIRLGRPDQQRTPTASIFISCPQDLIGHVTCSLRICSHYYGEKRRRKDPDFRALGEGFMKDISTILLASAFVIFSLIVLLSAASTLDRTSSTLDNDQQRVSELGLRFGFKR
jgi:hypothetical protein